MNGQGQVTGCNKGKTGSQNGKNSTISYTNGFVTAFSTPTIQNYQLIWDDQKGNLTSRKDARDTVNKIGTFLYDGLNRLTSATVNDTASIAAYASNGNIASKTGLGAYLYNHPSKFKSELRLNNVVQNTRYYFSFSSTLTVVLFIVRSASKF
ncbi:hypothetical protein SAMN05216327_10216 [Dyadobacter sp. SG02]|uniref:hypothetical protein n=1 Tax=Dyadobacter sp. SG02 TaxID=1855291 RepID=UPI0008BCB970|nr:hypothetical protein [Dyadobacter sp. SG02]SEI49344.1 hypothetical protein SAMN05216327_10216 [Dyadobacter sp. SG02]